MTSEQLERLAIEQFDLRPTAPIHAMLAGNINRTAVVKTDDGAVVLQEMNTSIFEDPQALMSNTAKIIERQHEHNLPALSFLRAADGGWTADLDGVPWRCYRFIDGSATPPITTHEDAQSTARAFGRFAKAIDGLELAEHLPGYHDFDRRVFDFDQAVEADELGRADHCEATIVDMRAVVDLLRLSSGYEAWLRAPVRNAHNDAKGPNCIVGLTGSRTIIDLDTTMPGTILSDIGELIRSSTRDLPDAKSPELMNQIEAVNRSFLAGYGIDLTNDERSAMLLAGPLMAIENAIRFLTDHLGGDKYYGANTPDQNLGRAIAQLSLSRRLVAAIEWATVG